MPALDRVAMELKSLICILNYLTLVKMSVFNDDFYSQCHRTFSELNRGFLCSCVELIPNYDRGLSKPPVWSARLREQLKRYVREFSRGEDDFSVRILLALLPFSRCRVDNEISRCP